PICSKSVENLPQHASTCNGDTEKPQYHERDTSPSASNKKLKICA
ncbi:unnamed protein product, partial [Didymodactylos carnosus]